MSRDQDHEKMYGAKPEKRDEKHADRRLVSENSNMQYMERKMILWRATEQTSLSRNTNEQAFPVSSRPSFV